jgi:hypothetical protein
MKSITYKHQISSFRVFRQSLEITQVLHRIDNLWLFSKTTGLELIISFPNHANFGAAIFDASQQALQMQGPA